MAYVKTFKTLATFHYVSVLCRTFRVMHLVACMDSFILQESAQLNFTHTQREIASSLSIFCTRFKNLGTPFATTFLAYKALKDGRGIDRASFAQLYSGAKKNRKN